MPIVPLFLRAVRLGVSLPLFVAISLSGAQPVQAISDGCDLEFGGPGTGPGQFTVVYDFAFDRAGNLYVLDGPKYDQKTKTYSGNRRIQKFDNDGRFLSERSLDDAAVGSAALGEKNVPQRIVVNHAGEIFVTQPEADRVWQIHSDGRGFRSIPVAGAAAIAVPAYGKDGPTYVIESRRGKGKSWLGGERIETIKSDGSSGIGIQLEKKLDNIVDLAIDPKGNFIFLADLNQIYVFSPTGKLLRTAGAGSSTRNDDGSEPLHSVATDSEGNVYTMTWGNPGLVTKYDASFTVVRQRDGQFKWADPWSIHSSFVPLAIDPHDRLWAAFPESRDPQHVHYKFYRPTPALIRAKADFLHSGGKGVRERNALLLGFKPSIVVPLPYNTAYDLQPIGLKFQVAAANRQIGAVEVGYRFQDAWGKIVDQGKFDLALPQGKDVEHTFSFTPPKFGWYTITCDCSIDGKKLLSVGEHLGVTPAYAQMKSRLAAGEANGSWDDAPRQMFCGLSNMRLHPKLDQPGKSDNLNKLEHDAVEAVKLGATVVLQFSDKKDCTPDNIRRYVERLKGRVKYWEVMNEPNFSMSAEDYATLLKNSYAVIKSADPEALVLGPSHCGISLPWIEIFLKAGGGKYLDIVSIHDYEGHESVDATHWRWKYWALRELLAKYGIGDKPVWQTERAISASRGGNFTGLVQAERTTLHRSLLESLGVPPKFNNHYYLNEGGYNTVPSYVWSRSGPYPAALALRTRSAMTEAPGQSYVGPVDFGPSGNSLVLGLRYVAGDTETIVLQTLGAASLPVEFTAAGTDALELVDPFGNVGQVSVVGGKVVVEAAQLPVYLRAKKERSITAVPLDFGRNIALRAQVAYSSTSSNGLALLNNGIVETYNAGHPHGGTDGKKIWQGDWPSEGNPTLELALPTPRRVNTAVVHGVQADNNFCALLDYDLQAEVAGQWKTLAEVRTPLTPTDTAVHGQNNGNSWYDGGHLFVHRFEPVETSKLRLVVLRATQGFAPDDAATTILRQTWGGKGMPMKVMVREVELYGPAGDVQVAASISPADPQSAPAPRKLQVSIHNHLAKPLAAQLRIGVPEGWKPVPETLFGIAAGAKFETMLEVEPSSILDAGRLPIDAYFIGVEKYGAPDKTAVVETDSVFVEFVSPVQVQPQSPSALDKKAQPLAAAVKNLSNAPISGTLELRLKGPHDVEPITQSFGPVAPNESQTVSFAVPNVDLARAPWTATYAATANRIRSRVEQPLNVRLWSIIGPFEKDIEKIFGPEQSIATGIDLKRSHVDGFGNEQKWKVVAGESSGMLNLTKHINPHDNVSAYAVVYVESPKAGSAIFSTGTDDGGKAWLNGKLIMNDDSSHPASAGSTLIPVELKAGRNEVVFKIMQGNGGWGCYLDFLDVKTRLPPADLIYTPAPQE
ncbi:MAG: hypothetical protein K8U03_24845 [Planctomycetia bacterium]|nr:hypothetical protein [Planctomycetia bacterium]